MADVRILLSDKSIAQLPAPRDGWYLARDTELKGFFVVIGKRKRTFTVQGDLRKNGKRISSVRVSIGDTNEITTRTARATAKEYLARMSRAAPKAPQRGAIPEDVAAEVTGAAAGVTLRQAWERYLDAHLVRKNRSEKTICGYRDQVERIFAEWLDSPLGELGAYLGFCSEEARRCYEGKRPLYRETDRQCGPCARFTITREKRTKSCRPTIPRRRINWNEEKRRDTGTWASATEWLVLRVGGARQPVRREFHLFTLLSGSRPAALQAVRPNQIDFRTAHIACPRAEGREQASI